jgi:hypothetical protein
MALRLKIRVEAVRAASGEEAEAGSLGSAAISVLQGGAPRQRPR